MSVPIDYLVAQSRTGLDWATTISYKILGRVYAFLDTHLGKINPSYIICTPGLQLELPDIGNQGVRNDLG